MSEAIEGTVQGVNANDRGVGFTLKGREGWYNFSKFLPREHQEGLTLPELPPEVREGQQVHFLYDVNKMGKSYIQVNPDGSHEFTVLDTAPPSQNGASSYDREKGNAIQWAVCLKAATDICIANHAQPGRIQSGEVLTMAYDLFAAGPSNGEAGKAADAARDSGELEKAAPASPAEFVEKVTVPSGPPITAVYEDDPGPQEP